MLDWGPNTYKVMYGKFLPLQVVKRNLIPPQHPQLLRYSSCNDRCRRQFYDQTYYNDPYSAWKYFRWDFSSSG